MLGRVVLISVLLSATLIFQWYRLQDEPVLRILSPTYGTISFVYAMTVVWSYLYRKWENRKKQLRFLAKFQIVTDIATAGFLVAVSGGPSSVFSFLTVVIVIYSGIVLSDRWAFWSAALGSLAHVAAVFGVFFYPKAILRETLGLLFTAPTLAECFYSVFVQSSSLFVAGALTSYVSERLFSTGRLLEQSEVGRRELEQLHERIVSNLTSGLITTDPSGLILYANRAAEMLLGTRLGNMIGRSAAAVVPAFSRVAEQFPNGVDRMEITVRGAEGVRHYGLTVTPLRDEAKAAKGSIYIFQDLTQLKSAEEQLKKADRLAAIGELAAGIAHEIRNPLASISGCVQMLKDDLPADASSSRLFSIVVREIDRLNGLITEFLQFARPKKIEAVDIDVLLWLEDIQLQFRASGAKYTSLHIHAHPSVRTLTGDRDMLTQAIWNLVRNAEQALGTSGQGRIDLSIFPEAGPGEHPWMRIEVKDNGPGIPSALKDKVFEPFFTTKPEGTGLGLSLAYKIVELHGGTMAMETGPSGTVFTIRLPAVRASKDSVEPESTHAARTV